MRGRWAVVVVALGVALAGCGSSGDDTATRALPPAPTGLLPSAKSSPAPSPLSKLDAPWEAHEKSPAGASAFAKYFFRTANQALMARDASGLRLLSQPSCKSCAALEEAAEKLPTGVAKVQGGIYTDVQAEVPPLDGSEVYASLLYSVSAVRTFDANGSILESRAAIVNVPAIMQLNYSNNAWSVVAFANTGDQ